MFPEQGQSRQGAARKSEKAGSNSGDVEVKDLRMASEINQEEVQLSCKEVVSEYVMRIFESQSDSYVGNLLRCSYIGLLILTTMM